MSGRYSCAGVRHQQWAQQALKYKTPDTLHLASNVAITGKGKDQYPSIH